MGLSQDIGKTEISVFGGRKYACFRENPRKTMEFRRKLIGFRDISRNLSNFREKCMTFRGIDKLFGRKMLSFLNSLKLKGEMKCGRRIQEQNASKES